MPILHLQLTKADNHVGASTKTTFTLSNDIISKRLVLKHYAVVSDAVETTTTVFVDLPLTSRKAYTDIAASNRLALPLSPGQQSVHVPIELSFGVRDTLFPRQFEMVVYKNPTGTLVTDKFEGVGNWELHMYFEYENINIS